MYIDKKKCVFCGYCLVACPMKAIKLENNEITLNEKMCVNCGLCINKCLPRAIRESTPKS